MGEERTYDAPDSDVDVRVFLNPDMVAHAGDSSLEITTSTLRVTVAPLDPCAPTAAEVDAFERLADVVLEVRDALREAHRDGVR